MFTRFLKGESFHDRPLISFSSSHLPEEEVTTAHGQKESVVDELQQSTFSIKPSLEEVSGILNRSTVSNGFNGATVANVVSTACVAFVLGIWVSRKTIVSATKVTTSSPAELQPLHADHYGSI